ncbi:MAG TPA: 3-hydroxyacyl-CoA dehydrogenase/enoyl-CoA hydratase family protein [Gemmatimonadales bacterium]|nr:3-hydroxyacyl-CoA dehydrogenase/enoyl-CoA hydratase family protein [Gemmatimonadales bacterium]
MDSLRHIRTLGVVGAGTMGGGIAALAASAGVPVVLLDVPGAPGAPDRSGPARQGLERQLKAKPAAFMDPARATLVRTGNTEDDLALLAGCDWVIEAIIEQPRPKQELFAKLEQVLAPTAIVASNTSGIPMHVLVEGRSPAFRRRFLGTHFFSPVRYMHLLELIPTDETAPAAIAAVRAFAERVLGKGTVVAKDAPGFVANRLGVKALADTMRAMAEHGLTIDEVDALTGPLLGRPNSATFRTGDITGLDVLAHVTSGLAQTTGEDFALPAWTQELIDRKQLGDKTGGGFYQKRGKEIFTFDPASGEYRPQRKPADPELQRLAKLPLAERVRAIAAMHGKYGDFLRRLLFTGFHYTLEKAPALAYDPVAVDRAMEWGYGHEAGPFRLMDMLGTDALRQGFRDLGLGEPALLAQATEGFYRETPRGREYFGFDGAWHVVPPVAEGAIRLATLARAPGRVLEKNAGARLLDLGDGVACLEFRSKMNTLGSDVLALLDSALTRVERDGLAGLVVGNDDPRAFSAGANLAESAGALQSGDWKALDAAVRRFQDAVQRVRRAPFPVVVAPHGLALGGGCELTLHADAVQAAAELYMGLVEVGVGLIPAGGGTTELLFRFTEALAPYPEADPFEAVKRAFNLIATAATSTSALDARARGLLRDRDRITMNRDLLIADAKRQVLALAPGYTPPVPRTIRALGKEGMGNLDYALFAFAEAGQATAHDVRIGHALAYVLCGGDGPPRLVGEQDILDLEREAFLQLLGTKETQERITHMLATGKPLRN